jgi:hypothetical protein
MTAIEWLAFFVLLVSALAAGAVVALSNGAVTRAIRRLERTYRRQKSLELEQLQAQAVERRRVEVERLLEREGSWQGVLDQVLADALPDATACVGREGVLDLNVSPAPRFTVAGVDGRSYLFTTSPEALRRVGMVGRKNRVIPLDATLSPAARVEVQVLWDHLASGRLRESAPALPRQAEWFLVVREAGRLLGGPPG